ncbi:MAG: tRNA (adenosine(37)-N6)-threonylcarbamoyltransferase complex transferase subunit TsaD [Prevotellaceae bacterium]|nr:tRNA (adenosine(37)-N6)-threonylcarbamoyltransferase complex transferase subunit TsaD [Prevotellaceae bacterium]
MMAIILGIESSCDDTSAAIIKDGILLSNIIANQSVHEFYGGVIPELASRAHLQNIVPAVSMAIKTAEIAKNEISAIAFTRGPGLMGSLLVGVSFAKGFAKALNIPMIEVNHLQGHILAHFLDEKNKQNLHPKFPFLCLLVSGGHTQIVVVKDYMNFEIIGKTIDDAAGEAFDKCAKVMELPYPGGPVVDKLAKEGNAGAFAFAHPVAGGLDYSFSGLKTSFLYFLRDRIAENPDFIEQNKADLCASLQNAIIRILMKNLIKASEQTEIKEIAISGGVSANSGLRNAINDEGKIRKWNVYLPQLKFTTDNAAMIAITGYFKYLNNKTCGYDTVPAARM